MKTLINVPASKLNYNSMLLLVSRIIITICKYNFIHFETETNLLFVLSQPVRDTNVETKVRGASPGVKKLIHNE